MLVARKASFAARHTREEVDMFAKRNACCEMETHIQPVEGKKVDMFAKRNACCEIASSKNCGRKEKVDMFAKRNACCEKAG